MEISLHAMLWIMACLLALVTVMGMVRKRQMQRASDLFEETDGLDAHMTQHTMEQDIVGRYGDQVVGKPREVSIEPEVIAALQTAKKAPPIIIMYIMAQPNTEFGGYDLQQSLANAGLIFGDMDIFHRYEDTSGKGQLLFSLASAVEPGTIDIANIGAYSTPGLCLFLDCNQHPYPMQSFTLMVHVAKQLAEELNGTVLSGKREPWTKAIESNLRDKLQRAVAA
jgi:cell division protein ZipA